MTRNGDLLGLIVVAGVATVYTLGNLQSPEARLLLSRLANFQG